ncbi:epoxide hydrolase family protein [Aspergillus fischeri NRRL 181]|uniref:Epoxide hydrolase family protein n=1 Tax=Neosartorya fischeri (strain ATCC 1020 / DSM 3700 / CBS 544.65 / FGSC A1164 / JCM 1740 / NRRL 181 / WB 181) TaxID=331117 RepID=A1CUY9_NEOFI|nr:epoxide hydrolase family protein [Aspergillus fischeri NRRL 181]EAW25566.1 epoxide hydrolase family protein [Aspergillus fischeri NRRL 181]
MGCVNDTVDHTLKRPYFFPGTATVPMACDFGNIPRNIPGKPQVFSLHVPDQDVADFRALLKLSKIGPRTWWNEHMDGSFGVSRHWLIKAKDIWLNDFDWRQQEANINSFPNFKIAVNNPEHGQLSVHFVALFSARPDAVPIIFMHGWPGSFLEFFPMLNIMTKKYTPESLPYHVIVPSLPGYGLSADIGHEKEFTLDSAAQVMNQLMIDLGFGKGYVAQGGDVGSTLSLILLRKYKGCKAAHVNFLALNGYEGDVDLLTSQELDHLKRAQAWQATGMAYLLEQCTRPATIGLALSSSPLALLAWIGEKILEWADEQPPLDAILANVSLYWFTSSFPRSIYPYRNIASFNALDTSKEKPLGYSYFPGELMLLPKAWADDAFRNMVQYSVHEKVRATNLRLPRKP